MNPYHSVIQLLLMMQLLNAFVVLGVTTTMKRQLGQDLSQLPAPLQLLQMHRWRFPNSPLRRMWVSCVTLCIALFAGSTLFIHLNSVQNRIYFANAQKQIQQNAQLINEMNTKGR